MDNSDRQPLRIPAPRRILRVRGGAPRPLVPAAVGAALFLSRWAVAGSAFVHAAIMYGLLQIPGAARQAASPAMDAFAVAYLGDWAPPPPPEPPRPAPGIPRALETIPPPVVRVKIPDTPPVPALPPRVTPPPVVVVQAPGSSAPRAMPVALPPTPAPPPEFESIRQAIYRNLDYPAAARRRGEEGRVLLVLTIRAGGILQEVVAEAGPAASRLVQAALAAARRAAPFPDAAAGQYRVPIVFKLAPATDHPGNTENPTRKESVHEIHDDDWRHPDGGRPRPERGGGPRAGS